VSDHPRPFRSPAHPEVVASVTDLDDAEIAMIYRHVETIMPEAGLCATVVAVVGDIDRDTADHLDHALRRAAADGMPVCCDLARTEFFGAAGAKTMLDALDRADDSGTVFLLRGVHGMSRRVLAALGLDPVFIVT
jgi:anti-anti-sigma factor